jgi:hypothetical protein
MTTLDGSRLTKDHIIFTHNNREYTININGDERLNVFTPFNISNADFYIVKII